MGITAQPLESTSRGMRPTGTRLWTASVPAHADSMAARNSLRCWRERDATSEIGTTVGSPPVAANNWDGAFSEEGGERWTRRKPPQEPPCSRWRHHARPSHQAR